MRWRRLGLRRGFVVHGSDGLDEITTTGSTLAFEVGGGLVLPRRIWSRETSPFPPARPEDLKGGDQQRNAEIARAVLSGSRGPQRDIVLANASAALVAAGLVGTFLEGAAFAALSIDSGAAREKVEALGRFSRSLH